MQRLRHCSAADAACWRADGVSSSKAMQQLLQQQQRVADTGHARVQSAAARMRACIGWRLGGSVPALRGPRSAVPAARLRPFLPALQARVQLPAQLAAERPTLQCMHFNPPGFGVRRTPSVKREELQVPSVLAAYLAAHLLGAIKQRKLVVHSRVCE